MDEYEVQFADLNDDNLFDIFKYLNIREKVRFERLRKRESVILEKVWLSQKCVATSFNYLWLEDKCNIKHHRVLPTDVLITNKKKEFKWISFHEMPIFKVLKYLLLYKHIYILLYLDILL